MKWVILVVWVLLSVLAGIFFVKAKHRKGRDFFLPLARILTALLPEQEKEKKKLGVPLSVLNPGGANSNLYRDYRAKKCAVCLLIVWAGLGLLFAASFTDRAAEAISNRLEREESDRDLTLEAEIEGKEGTEQIEVEVEAKDLSEEEVLLVLGEADAYIEQYFAELGKQTQTPEFPDAWKSPSGTEVTFSYYSLEEDLADDSGKPADTWPQEETVCPFKVIVWAGEYKSSVEVEVTYAAASELSAEEQWALLREDLEADRFADESGVTLPEETVGGLKIQWKSAGRKTDLALGLAVILLLVMAYRVLADRAVAEKARKRRREAAETVPEVVSELLIFLGAGQSIRNAMLKVDSLHKSTDNYLREEWHRLAQKVRNGFDLPSCLDEFSERMQVPEVRRLCIILEQSRRLGNEKMLVDLKLMHQELWDEFGRKKRTRSEQAETKMLAPLMLMLVVVFVIVLAPAFMNLNGF